MTRAADNFDRLISSAAPAVPDCAVDRRTTRAQLHQQMGHGRRRQPQRLPGRGLAWAASLTFLLVLAGQVGQLGSDGFDVQMNTLKLGNGETIEVAKSVFRGGGTGVPAGMSTAEVRGMVEAVAARDGAIKAVTGIAFNSDTPNWQVELEDNINGRIITTSRDPLGLSVPSAPLGRDKIAFLVEEWEAFLELVESGKIPARPAGQVSAEGIVFDVQCWTRDYPAWGRVTYYHGLPTTAVGNPHD